METHSSVQFMGSIRHVSATHFVFLCVCRIVGKTTLYTALRPNTQATMSTAFHNLIFNAKQVVLLQDDVRGLIKLQMFSLLTQPTDLCTLDSIDISSS